jgi:hypothetical protein
VSHTPNNAEEPKVTYSGSRRITFSDSFEEDRDYQVQHWAGLSPEQRFEEFYSLMTRFYSFTRPDWKAVKIVFDK